MALIVQKYGGTSVGDADKIKNVARRIALTKDEGNSVVVVVSAMGDTTDDLIRKAREITESPDLREFDASRLTYTAQALPAFRDAAQAVLDANAVQARPEDLLHILGGAAP